MEQKKNDKSGNAYEVNPMGSLGLLATGYRGVQAWREVRKKAIQQRQNGGGNEQKKD